MLTCKPPLIGFWHPPTDSCLGHFKAEPCKTLEYSTGSVVSQVNTYIHSMIMETHSSSMQSWHNVYIAIKPAQLERATECTVLAKPLMVHRLAWNHVGA